MYSNTGSSGDLDVDEGNTVMDYLPAERERGITIQSAAITFPWNAHRFNLIDTPGHADFTFEVERSLRVLDGAITILDAVAGVEAQTEKVWAQANTRRLPRIIFINKMDRTGAGFGRTIREVAAKLRTRPVVLQLPLFESGLEGGQFIGVVDLLTRQCLVWSPKSNGKEVHSTALSLCENAEVIEESARAITAIVETLSELDEDVINEYLIHEDPRNIPVETLKKAIRRLCLDGSITPVLTGAAFRNIGVQPLLDAVIDYLPSPDDRGAPVALIDGRETELEDKHGPCALAFKVIVDQQRGPMVFVRVYSGSINRGSILYNTTTRTKERVMRILHMFADDAREVESILAGNIAVILGLKDTKTGDTLLLANKNEKNIQLEQIDIPPPVFLATLETSSTSETKALEAALENLLREDPSLRVTYDEDTGQTLLSGMGELHLEIASRRLTNDFKVKVDVGNLLIGYRETVTRQARIAEHYERTTSHGRSAVHMSVELQPLESRDFESKSELMDGNLINIRLPEDSSDIKLREEDAKLAVRNGASAALSRGLILGYPIHSARLSIEVAQYEVDTDLGALSGAARALSLHAMEKIGREQMSVLEPIMSVSIVVDDSNLGSVMNDLTGTRGGQVLALDETNCIANEQIFEVYAPPDSTIQHNEDLVPGGGMSATRVVRARVPLKEMIGYSRALRALTGGRGTFTMSVHNFEPVTRRTLQQLRNGPRP